MHGRVGGEGVSVWQEQRRAQLGGRARWNGSWDRHWLVGHLQGGIPPRVGGQPRTAHAGCGVVGAPQAPLLAVAGMGHDEQ